jgi:hypothetical protein
MKLAIALYLLILLTACGKPGSSVDSALVGSWTLSGQSCDKPFAPSLTVLTVQPSGESFQTTTQGSCIIADHLTLANMPNSLSVTFHGATAENCPHFTPSTETQTVLMTYEVTATNLKLVQSNGCYSTYGKN